MKALFLTTETVDCANHVRAWNSVSREPAVHLTYRHQGGLGTGSEVVQRAMIEAPEVIFYIGAHKAPGNPKPQTLKAMREVAPLINLCSDAADRPWHEVLREYAREECFTLQVAIDGARDAPVDLATLTPVDARAFSRGVDSRDIRCGFSGSVGRWNSRSEVVKALQWFGGLVVRPRDRGEGSYDDHVRFLRRCDLLLNLSWTGTGRAHHVKGRVVEAGFAGCALLEHEASPAYAWFPAGTLIPWATPIDIRDKIESLPADLSEEAAGLLRMVVLERYTADQIYGEILSAAGLTSDLRYVDDSISRQTA